jgi:hypothetical protein
MTTPRVTSMEWMRWSLRIADLSTGEGVGRICPFYLFIQ